MRPASSANVATTDVRPSLPFHPPLAYNSYPSYSDYSSSKHEASFRPRTQHSLPTSPADQRYPWSGVGGWEVTHRPGLMSERAEQGQSGSSTRDGSSAVSPTASSPPKQTSFRAPVGARSVTSPIAQGQSGSTGRFELPPLTRAPSATADTFLPPTPRIAGVSSILNPSQDSESTHNRRRKASQLESPRQPSQPLPSLSAPTQGPPPPPALPGQSPGLQHAAANERPPRRILTPRSPSLHKAASLGQLNSASGTISAQRNPFPASPHSRAYTIEPGAAGAPPLPTTPGIHRPGNGFPTQVGTESVRRASGGTARSRAVSGSESPSTNYSSSLGQTSPATHYVTTTPGGSALHASSMEPTYGISASTGSGAERQRPMGIPISSSGGQNVYQMMTLETTSGTVQLPVDVQAASRVADEKRRRNAGASARFRQRRKEKEKEASTTISRLEQQVRELSEDAEFYRRERDIFVGILGSIPGYERHLARPASPRLRRTSVPAFPGGLSMAQEQEQRSPEGRNVRRRTSTFSLPPPPPPAQQPQTQLPPPNSAFQSNYGTSGYATSVGPQTTPAGHQGRSEHVTSTHVMSSASHPQPINSGQAQQPQPQQLHPNPTGPPQVLQPAPQTGPWNPYPSDRRTSGNYGQQRDGR